MIDSRRRFVVLVALMLAIAIGHLYVIDAFDGLILGMPTWLLLEVAVIAILFVLAWLATEGRQ